MNPHAMAKESEKQRELGQSKRYKANKKRLFV